MVALDPAQFSFLRSPFLRALGAAGPLLGACGLAACSEEPKSTPEAKQAESPATSEASQATPGRAGRSAAAAVSLTGEEPDESSELGALHGTILFAGAAPERFPLGASSTPECKHHPEVDQRSNVLIVNDGKLANAYVTIDSGYDRAKVPPASAATLTLSQKGCMYVPRVLALRVGQTLRVTNDDPTNHNVHARGQRNGELNKNMGKGQEALEFRFDKPEKPVPFACDIHPWMGAAVYVEEHPWFAVTDEQGAFRIRDLPPGEYVVEVTHEALKRTKGTVRVEAGKSSGFTLTLSK